MWTRRRGARLDRGDGSALLIIPAGFVAAVLDDKPAQLQLITNPAQRILPGIAKELLDILREAVFYAHRLMGPEIRQIADRVTKGEPGFSDVELSLLSVSMGQKFRRLERCLSPRLIELETVADAAPSSAPAAAVPLVFYFLPGMLLMGLLFTAQGISDDIWREREQGILRRVVTTPYGVTWFLVGKVLAATAIAALVAAIVLAAGMAYFQLPARRWPLAVVWTTGLGVLFTTVMFAIQVFASSHRGASVLSLVVVFPLMMLGGSMFPLEIMPPWLAAIGRWTPNGWGNEQLTAILLGREAPYPHLVAFALLSASVALCLLVAGTRLARTFARS